MRSVKLIALFIFLAFSADYAVAQNRLASPRGQAATQLGPGGSWIEVDYGRPILRGRDDIFGAGSSFGQTLNAGAPVWRAGANQSTRLMTEVALKFGNTTVPAGEYTMFVELSNGAWTLIISKHKAKANYRDDGDGLWGSYGYTKDMDVVRVPMAVEQIDMSIDQFTIGFVNMNASGGTLGMWWGKMMAMAPFSVAK